MLTVNRVVGEVYVSAEFNNGLNCIDTGISGNGKTFLLNMLQVECMEQGIPYQLLNYNFKSADVINNINRDYKTTKVFLFDNSDLYLTQEIVDLIYNKLQNCVVVMSLKHKTLIRFNFIQHRVQFDGKVLECTRL